ncbi:GSCOCG00009357001-RA-CDS [Cotesia congregata]|nr:GSCOCG00009357001-RA-CDS [Cotesia congregata]
MKQTWIIFLSFFIEISKDYRVWSSDTAWMDQSGKQCESAVKQVINEDRAKIVDDSPGRLHANWLSQECEVRTGPEYIIRKYRFYENGTFTLIRHHYAEESCSIATHTVVATGVIRLLSSSGLAPGATETKYRLDHVYIIPLTPQVAHKFGHRVNISCTPQSRWRAFGAQVIYESQSSQRYLNLNLNFEIPTHYPIKRTQKSLHHRSSYSNINSLNCLESLGIDYNELKLIRVEKKTATSTAFGLGLNGYPRVELLLGSLPPNSYSKKSHRSSSLQPTALIRSDTTRGCLICGAILRSTKNNPPLLHQVAALPALLGGSWISSSCESCEGGLWIKRQLQFYSGDFLWTGRWDYYSDPKCNYFLYTVTAAGSYIQRPEKLKHNQFSSTDDDNKDSSLLTKQAHSSSNLLANKRRYKRKSKQVEDKDYSKYDKWHVDWITSDSEKLLDILGSNSLRMPLPSNLFKNNPPTRSNSHLNIINKLKIFVDTTTSRTITFSSDKKNFRVNYIGTHSATDDSYRHLLENSQPSMAESFTMMLKGNQNDESSVSKVNADEKEETILNKKKSSVLSSKILTGTTELDLHVAESLLIPGDLTIVNNCGGNIDDNGYGGFIIRPLNYWPRNCVKHAIETPSTLGLRAKIGVNWSGQYTLLLGPRDDNLWEPPLRQCGSTPSYNYVLRAHLRLSLGYKYGLLISSSSSSLNTFALNKYYTVMFFTFTLLYSLKNYHHF